MVARAFLGILDLDDALNVLKTSHCFKTAGQNFAARHSRLTEKIQKILSLVSFYGKAQRNTVLYLTALRSLVARVLG